MLNYVFNDIFFNFYVSVPVSHTVLQVSELKNISQCAANDGLTIHYLAYYAAYQVIK